MARHVMFHSSSSFNRRHPLLKARPSSAAARAAEVAGEATAECTAVFCCCPCVVADLLLTAVYRLPAGLCRKAIRHRRLQRLSSRGNGGKCTKCSCRCDEPGLATGKVVTMEELLGVKVEELSEMAELEEEMWKNFYSTGFWRSPSRKDSTVSIVA